MQRIISPPKDDLDKLRQPLTDGERKVFNFLEKYLPLEWEIYIQPHLNGLSPDFVLLHPTRGIQIVDVKDWNLSAMKYRWETAGRRCPLLKAEKKGESEFSVDDPVAKLQLYAEEFMDLYCPRLGNKLAKEFSGATPVVSKCIAMPGEMAQPIG